MSVKLDKKTSELRCPSTGYCWRDGRRKCYYGVAVAVFCHSRDPLDSLNCPDTYKKYQSRLAKRVQRKRAKGWKMPPNTVYVGRPSKWGNPYTVGEEYKGALLKIYVTRLDCIEKVLEAYELWVRRKMNEEDTHFLDPLIGKDLACWCPLDKPCHADILLKILEDPYYSVRNRCVLIGGYPQGHYRPFDIQTRSGSILRQLVSEVGLNAVYIDLWQTEQEEKEGKIEPFVLSVIRCHISQLVNCVALGKWVWKCLHNAGIDLPYLPHPASRSGSARLREGLEKLSVYGG